MVSVIGLSTRFETKVRRCARPLRPSSRSPIRRGANERNFQRTKTINCHLISSMHPRPLSAHFRNYLHSGELLPKQIMNNNITKANIFSPVAPKRRAQVKEKCRISKICLLFHARLFVPVFCFHNLLFQQIRSLQHCSPFSFCSRDALRRFFSFILGSVLDCTLPASTSSRQCSRNT